MKVMCCGDSITQGGAVYTATNGRQGGYRRHLNSLMPAAQFVGSQCAYNPPGDLRSTVGQHEGYGGATTATIRSNVMAGIATYDPDVVLWMSGTNDVSNSSEDPETVYNAAVAVLGHTSVSTVIVSNCPHRKSTATKIAETTAFRAAMATYFTETAAPLPAGMYFHDVGGVLSSDDLFNDDLHPNLAGYQAMADEWAVALVAAGVTLPTFPTTKWVF